MFGTDFTRLFGERVDKVYSNYLTTTEENDLHKEALYSTISEVYNVLSTQESYDNIASVIRTNQVFIPSENQIFIAPIPIANLTPGLPTLIETTVEHKLSTNDNAYITGVQGTASGVNDTFHQVTVIDETNFSIPIDTTALTYTASTGEISQITDASDVRKMVNDYWALLALKAKFSQTLKPSVIGATNKTPIVIELDKISNVKSGEQMNISGVGGNTNANGDYYVKQIGSKKFELYSDKDMIFPVAGNGAFAGVGTIKRVFYKDATPYFSNKRISEYSAADLIYPQFDRSDNMIKILPSNRNCEELTIDYIATPPIHIDIANSTEDLEKYYHYDFLIMVVNKSAKMFFERSKDFESLQADMAVQQEKK